MPCQHGRTGIGRTPQPYFCQRSAANFSPHSAAILLSALRRPFSLRTPQPFFSTIRSHPSLSTLQSHFCQRSAAICAPHLRSHPSLSTPQPFFSPHSAAILLSAFHSHPSRSVPQPSFSQRSAAILLSALRSKMVENLQQLIQKATGVKDPYKFKWNNEYIASCLGMNKNDVEPLHTQFKKNATVYVKRAMDGVERGSKIDCTSMYSSACNNSWRDLISCNAQLLESSEQIKGLDTGVEWINLVKWYWTKLFKDSEGKKRRRQEREERESGQRKKSKTGSRVTFDQHYSPPLPE